ncbi:hypothetical protein [Mycobacterium sp. NAZ190054]|uniref:hypothetical protein n=1 Tax=Mycobacterium sp. NAZ190054 TaxID=1747766 RepID=UPI0012E3CE83|nr:hypothetical protein [Mycobacterium sp. NAZ190054]
MSRAGLSRSILVAVSGALAAGWLLVGCGGDDASDGEMSPTETTTEMTTTETTTPTEGENTIEIPSPNIDIPSPEMPEITTSPAP